MWFFFSVLVLWGSTATMGRLNEAVLPPLVLWVWWTAVLYLCGLAAVRETYNELPARLMGLFGFTMVVIYYTSMSDTYMGFLPVDEDNPNLWPTVFLSLNLVGPVLLITLGCMRATVQRE